MTEIVLRSDDAFILEEKRGFDTNEHERNTNKKECRWLSILCFFYWFVSYWCLFVSNFLFLLN